MKTRLFKLNKRWISSLWNSGHLSFKCWVSVARVVVNRRAETLITWLSLALTGKNNQTPTAAPSVLLLRDEHHYSRLVEARRREGLRALTAWWICAVGFSHMRSSALDSDWLILSSCCLPSQDVPQWFTNSENMKVGLMFWTSPDSKICCYHHQQLSPKVYVDRMNSVDFYTFI